MHYLNKYNLLIEVYYEKGKFKYADVVNGAWTIIKHDNMYYMDTRNLSNEDRLPDDLFEYMVEVPQDILKGLHFYDYNEIMYRMEHYLKEETL